MLARHYSEGKLVVKSANCQVLISLIIGFRFYALRAEKRKQENGKNHLIAP
jgi:hypothetical protein